MGQGKGNRADEEVTNIRFIKKRTPVHTTKGSLISKMFVNGEQVKGDVSTEAVELISAAERDATDALNNNKVPNQYRDSVKKYFSDIASEFQGKEKPSEESSEEDQDKADENKSGA